MEPKNKQSYRKEQIELNTEQKHRNHGTKKETRLARRNKLNLNTEQKNRNRGTQKGTRLARRKSKRRTKI
jgi:hypothetical protein